MMPRAIFTIDGNTVLDADLGPAWQERPPAELAELIAKVQTTKQPWLKAAMMPLTEAFISNTPVTITVQTSERGWTLTVHHPLSLEPDPPHQTSHATA